MDVKEAIAAICRNVRFGDDGDRRAVAEFLGRDADAPDPFGPLPETESDRIGDDKTDDKADDKSGIGATDGTDGTDGADDKTGGEPDKPPTPATVRSRAK